VVICHYKSLIRCMGDGIDDWIDMLCFNRTLCVDNCGLDGFWIYASHDFTVFTSNIGSVTIVTS
jgi:hypothetical protein